MIKTLILSLALTLLFELLYAMGWKVHGKDLLPIILMNVLTNPLVVLWNTWVRDCGYIVSTLLPELAAIAVEAILLKKYGKDISYPILLAVCINLFSYILGLFVNYALSIL